jgi:hypothetical protein
MSGLDNDTGSNEDQDRWMEISNPDLVLPLVLLHANEEKVRR